MKKFYNKIIFFVIIEVILILSIIIFYNYNDRILFISNSVSFNAKAEFINKNRKRFDDSKIVIIGSSMSLNNIDTKQIQDSFKLKTINISSWGTKLFDFQEYNIWSKKIIININFTDLGSSFIIQKNGFPMNNTSAIEMMNIASDFSTYRNQYTEINTYTKLGSDRCYTNLNFDSLGTAYLESEKFEILKSRWDEDIYLKHEITRTKVDEFVNSLNSFIEKVKPKNSIIISFSPGRRCFYNLNKQNVVDYLEQQIALKSRMVRFVNLYNIDIPDSYYVDNCHFNHKGNELFTMYLLNKIL